MDSNEHRLWLDSFRNMDSVVILMKLLGDNVMDGRLKLKLNLFFDDDEVLSLDLAEEDEQSMYSVIPAASNKISG